jgi:glycolate oxidase FAD binding subunit
MKVVQADGTVTKSGGKVVKNVSGYDLMRPNIGAFGTLGVIAEVSFKLIPLPAVTRTCGAAFRSLADARRACEELLLAPFQPERFALVSGPAAARSSGKWSGSQASVGDGAHLLVLTLAAGRAAVDRMMDETRSIAERAGATWHDVIEETEADLFWSGLEHGASEPGDGPGPPFVSIRATFKPSAGFDFIRMLHASAMNGGVGIDTTFHAGFGTVLAHFSADRASRDAGGGNLGAATLAIQAAREAAAANGAIAVIERCPTELKRRIDVWGAADPSVEIMRSMKMQFDPAGTLNPGRFVGGI